MIICVINYDRKFHRDLWGDKKQVKATSNVPSTFLGHKLGQSDL